MTETLAQPPLTEAAEGPGIPGISAAGFPVGLRRYRARAGGEAMTPTQRICARCRRTRLSRYNRQQVCAPCARAAACTPEPGTSPRQWPAWLWESEQMRQVLARCELGTAVAMFRAAAHLSQHELAELTGWSQSAVSLVETGRRDTLYDIRELLRFADTVAMPREALLPVLLGQPAVLISAALAHGDYIGDAASHPEPRHTDDHHSRREESHG